jgi:predicted RecA/RadA family phage recombinase
MGQVKTDGVGQTYTDEVYPVGTRYVQPADEVNAINSTHYGDKEWVFVYNDEASTAWAEGDVIMLDNSDYKPFHGLKCTATLHVFRILGVAAHAIAAGSYGWIIAKGVGEVTCGGSVAQGDRIVGHASTAGQAQSLTLNADATTDNLECVFGMALEADGSAGSKATCWINGVW